MVGVWCSMIHTQYARSTKIQARVTKQVTQQSKCRIHQGGMRASSRHTPCPPHHRSTALQA